MASWKTKWSWSRWCHGAARGGASTSAWSRSFAATADPYLPPFDTQSAKSSTSTTETRVKQQALSLGGGEGEKERGNHKSYPQPHPHPHPQQLPSAIIPPTAPEVIFERPVVNTAPKISTTHQSAEKLQLDQMLAGNAEDDARRKRAQEAADEAFARQMQEEERKRPLWSTAAPAKDHPEEDCRVHCLKKDGGKCSTKASDSGKKF